MISGMIRVASTITLAAVVNCSDPKEVFPPEKGKVDHVALQNGVTVTLADELGSLSVPFIIPVDYDDEEDFRDALTSAVTLVVTSSTTGVTADLVSGILVDEAPDDEGEWNFVFVDGGSEADLTFFNRTTDDLTLKVDAPYEALLSIAENDYIVALPAISVPITVVAE